MTLQSLRHSETLEAYAHLTERAREVLTYTEAREVLSDTDESRILHIKSPRWIGYTRTNKIRDQLQDLLVHPKTNRMPNLLIVGPTNNGKTELVRKFLADNPADDNLSGESIHIPVVLFQAPPEADEGRLYEELLKKLFAPFKETDKASRKQHQAMGLLQRIETKVLVIDELHHVLSGTARQQRRVLQAIKYLGNELRIPIVGVGTKDALRALQIDPQLANRFEPAPLPLWKKDEEFVKLLMSFEKVIPLKRPSNLAELGVTLHDMSEGHIGELSTILNKAAVYAIGQGTEFIDENALKGIDWVLPSERRKEAELLFNDLG